MGQKPQRPSREQGRRQRLVGSRERCREHFLAVLFRDGSDLVRRHRSEKNVRRADRSSQPRPCLRLEMQHRRALACGAVRLGCPALMIALSAMTHGSLLANAGRCSWGRGSAAHRAIRLLDGSDFPSRRVRAPHSSFLHDTRTRRSAPVIAFSLRTTQAPYCGSTTCWVQIGRIGQPRIYAWRDSAAQQAGALPNSQPPTPESGPWPVISQCGL
jgi:hypothetical protein